jgi:hypothetical protein
VEVVIIKWGGVARRGVLWRFFARRNRQDGRNMEKTRMKTWHGGGSGGGGCRSTDLANVPTEHYHFNIFTGLRPLFGVEQYTLRAREYSRACSIL